MQIRQFYETDGICFARLIQGCAVLNGCHPKCGTYECSFYKPKDCEDWVRIDNKHMVRLFTPEEVTNGKNRLKSKRGKV